jgi:hypothetical protein
MNRPDPAGRRSLLGECLFFLVCLLPFLAMLMGIPS